MWIINRMSLAVIRRGENILAADVCLDLVLELDNDGGQCSLNLSFKRRLVSAIV